MARQPRKSRTKASVKETEKLISAVKFVANATNVRGQVYTDHLMICKRTIIAFDGIIAAGAIIDEDLMACPSIKQLLAAIDHCQSASALTQVSPDLLRISSSKFRANIDCVSPTLMQDAWPDNVLCEINQALIDALILAGNIVTDSADRVIQCSVQLTDNIVAATDGGIAVQIWTGVSTCGHTLAIPKMFINKLAKTAKQPTHMGVGTNSLTIYYSDYSWMRTQLYAVTWPPIDRVFAHSGEAQFKEFPADFHSGVDDITAFVENNVMFISDNILASHAEPEKGAIYTLSATMGSFKTSAKHLSVLAKLGVTHYGIYDVPDNEVFYAKSDTPALRVAISAME